MYLFLSENKITRRYVRRLSKLYGIVSPSSQAVNERRVLEILLLQLILSGILLLFPLRFGAFNMYYYLYLLPMCYLVNRQLVMARLEKAEYGLLKQMEHYLGEIRHFYHLNGTVEEAVYESQEQAPAQILAHINTIYDILLLGDDGEVEKYKEQAPNKFLVTFLALCWLTVKYGDTYEDGSSLFLANLNHLKTEIHLELLKREKVAHTFAGLLFITIIPMFSFKPIEKWGMTNLPELTDYYQGSYGLGVTALIFAATVIAYLVISQLKEEREYLRSTHEWLDWLGEVGWIKKFLWGWGNQNTRLVYQLHKVIKRTGEGISVNQYILRKLMLGLGSFGFLVALLERMTWLSSHGRSFWFHFMCVLLAGMGGIIVSGIPRFVMEIRGFFLKQDKEDEVMQFHSILLMLIHIERMNIETILEWLEMFSNIFRTSLQACVDQYPYDGEAALEKLKGEEPFPPFLRIVENLEVSDRTGIRVAFEEIASQQKYYEEKRKQDNEILITNKGVIGKVIAYVPLILTLGFYLIVPFVLESITQLAGFMEQMNVVGK